MLKTVLRDPLIHFLGAGLALFLLFMLVSPDDGLEEDPTVIQVERAALLEFIQYRARTFEPGFAAGQLDALNEQQLDRLIEDYVREEALYRQAVAWGLDENDYIIRRRMMQKTEFLARGVAQASAISEEEITAFYAENAARYQVSPEITFTHVFFDAERRGWAEAEAEARAAVERLNAENIAFVDAPQHSDRFAYFTNYVDRTPDLVAAHFSPEMAQSLFTQEIDPDAWVGPFRSELGWHVVRVLSRADGYLPELADIYDQVEIDALADKEAVRLSEAIDIVVDSYTIVRAPDLQQASDEEAAS